jgi:hypothetical protein
MSFPEDTTTRVVLSQHPARLFSGVLARLEQERQLSQLRHKVTLYGSLFCAAAVLCLDLFRRLAFDFDHSGAGDFIRLWFSDFPSVQRYWQELSLGVVESLPVFSLMLFLFAFFAALVLLQRTALCAKAVRTLAGAKHVG